MGLLTDGNIMMDRICLSDIFTYSKIDTSIMGPSWLTDALKKALGVIEDNWGMLFGWMPRRALDDIARFIGGRGYIDLDESMYFTNYYVKCTADEACMARINNMMKATDLMRKIVFRGSADALEEIGVAEMLRAEYLANNRNRGFQNRPVPMTGITDMRIYRRENEVLLYSEIDMRDKNTFQKLLMTNDLIKLCWRFEYPA